MSFLQYIKDKRYLIALFVVLMIFVSLMMFLRAGQQSLTDIFYIDLVYCFFAGLYILIGYFYRNAFYRQLKEAVNTDQEDVISLLPAPQTGEQALYLALLRKLNEVYSSEREKLITDKKDHQDFIMSWIHEVKLPIAAGRLIIRNSTGKPADIIIDKFEDELDKIDNYVEQALYYSRIDSFSRDYYRM